jgi:hypothetical protein
LSSTGRIAKITSKIRQITSYETMSYLGENRIVDIDRSSDSKKIKS